MLKCLLKISFLIIITSSCAIALRCYTCNYRAGIDPEACLKSPETVPGKKITNCPMKYCTIVREETKKPPNAIKTFSRGCVDKPVYLNDMIEDMDHKYFYRSCTTDLCNTGNGISSTGSITDPDSGAGENMVVPGRNTATRTFITFSFILMACLFATL